MLQWLQTVARVPFHLTWGTLLGARRKESHIDSETDIDIAMDRSLWDAAKHNITANLGQTGFLLITDFIPAMLQFSDTNTVHVDIWLYDRWSSTTDEQGLVGWPPELRTDVVQKERHAVPSRAVHVQRKVLRLPGQE
jgi:hypothetical protein